MALQMEDAYDLLRVIHPQCDFVMLMGNSAGHGKKLEGGLDTSVMNKKWGGRKIEMRDTVVPENGLYGATHLVWSVQRMHFQEEDEGSFDLSLQHRHMKKYPIRTGVFKIRQKTREELLRELKQKGFAVRGHYTMKQLRQFATHYKLPLEIREEEIKHGVCCKCYGSGGL